MKKFLFLLFLIPYFASGQLSSIIVKGDTLYNFNPTTGVLTQLTKLVPPMQAGKFVSSDGTGYIWQTITGSLGYTPVPNTRTVNGHALSADVTVTASDLSLGNVTNESKATMFTNATFTGTFTVAAGSISNAALANAAVANLSGTNSGDQTITLTGDITGSGTGSFATAIGSGKVTNTMLAGSIAYSKLSLTGAVLNADLAGSIAYSKLSLTGAILNADLAGSIAYGKLSLTGAILNADLAGSIDAAKLNTGVVSNTEFNYLDGVTSAIQTQLNAKASSALTSAHILVGNVSNVAADVAVSGDITIDNTGAVSIGASKVTNTMLAGSIAYSKLSLTGAILNADLAGSIAYSKLSLTGAILNADLAGSIAYGKLSLTGAILNADLAGSITEAKLLLANNTTGNVTTSAHGFVPILPNDNTKFLDGTGAFSVPAGGTVYTFSTGLNNSSGTITAKLATGFAGGQTVTGGTASGENLTLTSTSNATKGNIYFGSAATSYFDEANKRMSIVNPNTTSLTLTNGSGIIFQNGTVSDGTTTTRWPPNITMEGSAWTGAADRVNGMRFGLEPVAGGTTSSILHIAFRSLGSSSYTDRFQIDNTGTILLGTWNGSRIDHIYGGEATGGTARQVWNKIDGTDFNSQWSTINESFLSNNFSDLTTLNASTSQHGLQAKGVNVATEFYRSDNTQDVPLTKWRLVSNALGSVILYEPPNQEIYNLTTSTALTSGTLVMTPVYVEKTTTLTGVKFWQVVQGSYTADQVNGIALYSYSGGTLTQVAISANDGTIWKASANTLQTVAFTGTYSAAPGVYLIVGLYHSSAQTTAPTIGGGAAFQNGGNVSAALTNSAKVSGTFAAQTTLASSLAMSSFSTTTSKYYFALY